MARRGYKKHTAEKPFLKSIEVVAEFEAGHPFDIPAIATIDGFDFDRDMTILVGENGAGKSTILEAIAVGLGFSEEGGSREHSFGDSQTASCLHEYLRLKRGISKPRDSFFLRAESFYNFSSYIEGAGDVSRYGGSLHRMSHGESFLAMLTERFSGNGLYILDEPEAALSPSRQLSALIRMSDLIKQNSQFIIATHSPILMAYPNAKIILLDEEGWRQVDYEETEHFEVTRYFLNNYQRQLERLLE